MLQYERIDVSEGLDPDKPDKSKEFMICHYWYFKDITYVCNKCHDLTMVVQDLKDLMILEIKAVDYRCYMFNMSRSDAINLLNNSVLDNKIVL